MGSARRKQRDLFEDGQVTELQPGPPEDIAMTIEALGAAELCNVYGSTETYGNCAVTDADDPLALRLHSQGLPLPGMTIRAVDPVARRPLPEGEIGELAVRGYVTPGRVITGRRNSMQSASPVGSECLIRSSCITPSYGIDALAHHRAAPRRPRWLALLS